MNSFVLEIISHLPSSEDNLVLQILNVVVELSSPLVMCVVDQCAHVIASIEDVQIEAESLF